jgi:predicted anti-sigma-YlaC factor YlaD
MTCTMMMSLGVYVLGAADTAERRRLEAHLPACPACREELTRLAPLPGLLAGIPESMRDTARSPGSRARSSGCQARRPARALRHGGTRLLWAAGATACLAAAAVTAGFWLSSGGGHHAAALTLAGTNPATHVSATATLTATSWGTSIQLQVSGLPENVECRLVVTSRTGRTEVTGVWDAWQNGPVSIPASASWRLSDIASLQVTTTTRNLVTISAGNPTTHDAREGAAGRGPA